MGQINCSNCTCTNKESELHLDLALKEDNLHRELSFGSFQTDISKVSAKSFVKSFTPNKPNESSIIKIQSLWRGYQVRKLYSHLKHAKPQSKNRFLNEDKPIVSSNSTSTLQEYRSAFTYKSGAVYQGQ